MAELKATIEISSVEAKRGSREIVNDLKSVQKQIASVIKSTERLSKAFSTIPKGLKTEGSRKILQQQVQDLKKVEAAHKQLNKTVEQAAKSSLSKQTQAYKTFANTAVASLNKVNAAAKALTTTLNSVNTSFSKTKGVVQQFSTATNVLATGTAKVGKASAVAATQTAQFTQQTQRAGKASQQAAHQTQGLGLTLSELSKVTQIALGPLSGVASRLTAFATLSSLASVSFAAVVTSFIGLGSAVTAAIKSTNALDDLLNKSLELGVAVEDLQRLRFIGEQSGIQIDQVDRSLESMTRRIGQAVDAAGQGGRALETLGLKAEDLVTLPVDEQLKIIADEFIKLEDDSIKAAVAADLFSRAGLKMINVLNLGSAGIEELSNKADELGLIFASQTVKDAERLNDEFAQLSAVIKVNFTKALIILYPIIESVTLALTDLSVAMARWIELRRQIETRTDVGGLIQEREQIEALIEGYQFLAKQQEEGRAPKGGRYVVSLPEVSPGVTKELRKNLKEGIQPLDTLNEMLRRIDEQIKVLNGDVGEFGRVGPEAFAGMRESARDLLVEFEGIVENLKLARLEYARTLTGGPGAGEFAKSIEVIQKKIKQLNATELSTFVNTVRQSKELTITELNRLSQVFDEKGKVIKNSVDIFAGVLGQPIDVDPQRLVAEVFALIQQRTKDAEKATSDWVKNLEDSAKRVQSAAETIKTAFDESTEAQGRLTAFRAKGEIGVEAFDIRTKAEKVVEGLSDDELSRLLLDLSANDIISDQFIKDVQAKFELLGQSGMQAADQIKTAFQTGILTKETIVGEIEGALKKQADAETALEKGRESIDESRKRREEELKNVEKARKKTIEELNDALVANAEAYRDQITNMIQEIELAQLGGRERAVMTAILERETEVRRINLKLGREEIKFTQEQRDELAKLAGTLYDVNEERKRQEEIIKQQEQLAEAALKPWKDFGDDVSQILVDSIADGLDSGKFEMERFFDDIKKSFFRAIAQSIVGNIQTLFSRGLSTLVGGITGAPTAGVGTGGTSTNVGGSLFSSLDLKKIGTTIGGSIVNFFDSRPSSNATVISSTGGRIVSFAVLPSNQSPQNQPGFGISPNASSSVLSLGSMFTGGGTSSTLGGISGLLGGLGGFLGNFGSSYSGGFAGVSGGGIGGMAGGVLGMVGGAISGGLVAGNVLKSLGGFKNGTLGIVGTSESPFTYDPNSGLERISQKVGKWLGALVGAYYGGATGASIGGILGGGAFQTAAQIVGQFSRGDPVFEASSRTQAAARGWLMGIGPLGGFFYNKPDIGVGIGTAGTAMGTASRGLQGGTGVVQSPFGFLGALGSFTGGDIRTGTVQSIVGFVKEIDIQLARLLTDREEQLIKELGLPDILISNPKNIYTKLAQHRIGAILTAVGIPGAASAVQSSFSPEQMLEEAAKLLQLRKEISALVDAMKGVVEVAPNTKAAFEEIEVALDRIAFEGPLVGFVEDIDALRTTARGKLREAFDIGIADQILGFVNPLALELANLEASQKARLEEAKYLGADLVQLERLSMLERAVIIEQFNEQFNGSIRNMLDDLLRSASSPLAPTTVFENVRQQFETTKTLAFGDNPILAAQARGDITGVAGNLLDVAEQLFASSPAFFEQFNAVVDTLNALLIDPFEGASIEQINLDQNTILTSISELLAEGNINQSLAMEALITEVQRLTAVVETQQASIDRLTRGSI